MVEFKYILEKYNGRNRFKCSSCGHVKEFARYIDSETGEYLADHVGRCNRESSCGYHYTPSEWIKDGGVVKDAAESDFKMPKEEPLPISYIDTQMFFESFKSVETSHFGEFICSLFGKEVAHDVLLNYMVARSKGNNGKDCIFWRVDINDNVRSGKIMRYNPETGKRDKEYICAVSGIINKRREKEGLKPLRFEQCFFGEHLLAHSPEKPVAIVESEKSAIIASVYMPQFVWIATGGASGCKWREYDVYKVLKGRTCTFYPDNGFFNKQSKKTCFQEWSERVERIADVLPGKFQVSRVLEDLFKNTEREDQDLIDVILRKDETGLAITAAMDDENNGYPVIFDYNISHSKR
jgi:hypothetical protein